MVTLQNYELLNEFLDNLKESFGVVAEVIFRNVEELMSFNYGFKYVWLDAAFWGAAGSFFVFMLYFIRRREYE